MRINFLSVCTYACLCVCISVSVCSSVCLCHFACPYLPVSLSDFLLLPVCLHLDLHVSLSFSQPVCPACLPATARPSPCLPACLSICLSICLSLTDLRVLCLSLSFRVLFCSSFSPPSCSGPFPPSSHYFSTHVIICTKLSSLPFSANLSFIFLLLSHVLHFFRTNYTLSNVNKKTCFKVHNYSLLSLGIDAPME